MTCRQQSLPGRWSLAVPALQLERRKPIQQMAQKTQAVYRLILIAAFLAVSGGVQARLQEEFNVFNSKGYAGIWKEKEFERFGVPQDCNGTMPLFGKRCDPEDAQMQFDLGVMYETGRGTPQDYRKAALWYRKAAEQGHADAQNSLGWMYENGKGVPQDYSEAVRLYREAAEQGNADAQFNLGVMYYNGRGVVRDLVQSHMWFSLSEGAGGAEASNNRKSVEAEMTPDQIEEAQKLARKWFEKNRK